MDKFESLKLNKEFRFLYGRGKSFVKPTLVLYLRKNNREINRLGITSGKKIGNAVKRNRARRVIRVAYRTMLPLLKENYDMVIVARTKTTFSSSAEVTADLKDCFVQAGIIKNEKDF